jgi:hypothetical protein
MAQSRTYKLRLSNEGIDLFLKCHCRLAHLLRDFIPYGVTLSVAAATLELQDACEVAAELDTQLFRHCVGDNIRFVGASTALTEAIERISDKLLESDGFPGRPRTGHLYIAALISLASAEDRQLIEAFRRIAPTRHRNSNT